MSIGKLAQGCSDIDMLVPRGNLKVFEDILEFNKFSSAVKSREDKILMLSASHQIASWLKLIGDQGDQVNVDLNFDIFFGGIYWEKSRYQFIFIRYC